MSLETRITELAIRMAQEVNKANAARGSLGSLQTTAKGSTVAAVNELAGLVSEVQAGRGDLSTLQTTAKASLVAAVNELAQALKNATNIDDGAPSSTKTFSSQKIAALVRQTVTDLVNGAPEAFDTLQELAAALQGQAATANDLLTQLGTRVRVDAAQTLSLEQSAQARANIGAVAKSAVGDTDTDLVAVFNAALA